MWCECDENMTAFVTKIGFHIRDHPLQPQGPIVEPPEQLQISIKPFIILAYHYLQKKLLQRCIMCNDKGTSCSTYFYNVKPINSRYC